MDIVFTGAAPKNITRAQATELAAKAGFKVRSSFCSKTEMVVANVDLAVSGKSRKLQGATEKGLPICSYEEFFTRFVRN